MSGESTLLAAREVAPMKNFVDIGGNNDTPVDSAAGGFFLVDCADELFFTYNHQRNSICVGSIQELASSQSNEDFQVEEELPLISRTACVITRLVLHPLSSDDCIIWGEKAAIVLKLGCSANNKFQITREIILAEKLHQENPSLKIVQCKWVPVAAQKIVIILNSDSFLRVYNASSGAVIGVFNVGPPECVPLITKFSPEVDPETPVDFDLGPFLTKSKLWTIFVLKISGTISFAMLRLVGSRCILDSYQPIDITGDASSSSEYNSILCSQNSPAALVLGSDCGSIEHLVLLPTTHKTSEEEEDDCEDQLLNRQFVFHLKEKIQLVKDDGETSCKFFFLQDPMFDGRYVCVHSGGIHLITLKFLEEMFQFLNSDENEPLSLSPSIFQHLMTWSFENSIASFKSVGLSFTRNQPQRLICCLNDDKTVIYSMPHVFDVLRATKISGNDNPFLEENRESGNISVLQVAKSMLIDMPPYLYSDRSQPNERRLEVLNSNVKLKGDQITGLHDATEYLLAYLDVLSLKSNDFKEKISRLLSFRQSLKDVSKNTQDRCDKYAKRHEMLSGRMEKILLQYHKSCPILTDQEKLWKSSFLEYKSECDKMKRTMESLDAKINDIEIKDKGTDTTLTTAQLKQIKDEISHQHNYITKIVKYVHELNKVTSST